MLYFILFLHTKTIDNKKFKDKAHIQYLMFYFVK